MVLEQHVLRVLSSLLEEHQLLQAKQADFRAHNSTQLVMLSVLDELRLTADKKFPSVLILLDLSATFDTVNHVQLTACVRRLGVTGTVLQWIVSFLEDRSQKV